MWRQACCALVPHNFAILGHVVELLHYGAPFTDILSVLAFVGVFDLAFGGFRALRTSYPVLRILRNRPMRAVEAH